MSRDARVVFSAIKSASEAGESKRKLLNGFKREVFVKDGQLIDRYGSRHRIFSKPDVFLALLIANLPNLRVLELHFSLCEEPCTTHTNWQRSRVDFPIWTWEVVELNAGVGRRQDLQCLQKLHTVTIIYDSPYDSGLFHCPRGLPWLRLPSINTLKLSGINLPSKVDLCKRSSSLENLSLNKVAISLHDLESLLETPKSLVSLSFGFCIFSSCFCSSHSTPAPTEVIELARRCQSATLSTLHIPLSGENLDRSHVLR